MKRIKITINQLGEPTIEADGYNGKGCEEATADIEKALTANPSDVTREYKPEWANPATEEQEQGVQIGFN